jgi:signal transduction histidine kinase
MLSGSASALHEIYSIAPGREGGAWLATSYGLINYRAGDLAVYTNFAGLGSDDFKRVRTVWEHSSGQVFLGIDFDGLHQMRDGSFLPVAGIPPVYNERRMVTSLSEDRQGVLWIASAAGLAQYREGVCRLWTRANGLSDNRTFGLACAADDSVWVGTESGGVNQFKEGHFCVYSTTNGLLSQNAWPLRAEPDGSVWVGTPVGLNLIRKDKISSVTMREGLFDNLLYCLLEDSRGNYWTFGNRGIWRVKKDELRAVADRRAARVYCVNYGEANGMASAEGNGDEQPNAAALPNGELWFPTTRGVVILNPETLRENRIPPPVVIEEVRVDDQVVFRDGGFPAASAVFQQPESLFLRLPPGRARTLEIRYTANTFIDSEKTRFRFRLHGNHGEWREADTRRVAVYTNLRPGAYRFAVEACNHHGYWSERPAEFAFELAPYFYETWPFYVCCGLVSCGCLVGWGVRRGVVRQRWERLQRAGALEAERNRIARDLHDDLGANLTSLALQIELGSGQVDSTVPSSQERQALAGAIRGVAARVREVVWSINPKCDTLESFCAYLCHYAEGFLAAAGLRCRLDFPEEQQAQPLSAEARHQLLLFVKEALNNVAKHAQANEVCLGVGLQPDGLSLTVADDGRGFCPQRKDGMHAQPAARETGAAAFTAGHGLSNMRRRIEALGGTLEVASEPGKGTRITARLPMPESATTSPSSI